MAKKMNKTIVFLYAVTLFVFLVFSYSFVDYNFFYLKNLYTGFSTNNREIATSIYIAFILLLFIFYVLFLRLFHKKSLNIREIIILIGLTVSILLFSYPAMLSYDIFNYITTAKVLFFYGENPYIIMPIEFIGEPFLMFTRAANKIALYGPVWILLTGIPYFLSFGNFLLNILTLKLLIGAFYLGIVFLIWKISRNIFSVALFALNPLIIVETLVSGHNDVVMMFFALFSFFLLLKKKLFLGAIFLTISILVKYATLFLAPVFIYVVIKTVKKEQIDREKVFTASAIFMGVIFLLSAFREEIYPWYAIWFLLFVVLIPQRKLLFYISLSFSFSLLLRYMPFILSGTYFGQTPFMKTFLTLAPPFLVFVYLFAKEKLWEKIPFFQQ